MSGTCVDYAHHFCLFEGEKSSKLFWKKVPPKLLKKVPPREKRPPRQITIESSLTVLLDNDVSSRVRVLYWSSSEHVWPWLLSHVIYMHIP